MYQVYILHNQQGKSYIGLSENIEQRLIQHNNGESKWTKKYQPWHLYWSSCPMSLSEARKLEIKMKKQKGGHGLKALMKVYQRS